LEFAFLRLSRRGGKDKGLFEMKEERVRSSGRGGAAQMRFPRTRGYLEDPPYKNRGPERKAVGTSARMTPRTLDGRRQKCRGVRGVLPH